MEPVTVPEQFNIGVHLVDRHVVEGRGDREAIRCEGHASTYAELQDAARRVGSGLRGFGVDPGERVLILLPDSFEFAASYLGAMRVGVVAVPTNTMLKGPDYAYFLDESRAKVLIAHTSLWAEIGPALAGRADPGHIVTVGGRPEGAVGWDEWLSGPPTESPPEPTDRDSVAFWLWTSGSTGPPKAAVHRHGDWVHCCERYARGVLGVGAEDVTFSAAKAFHAYGLGNGTVFPLYAGARTIYLSGRPTPESVLALVQRERPTLFFAVPTQYAAMLASTDRENPYDLSSVRHCVSAGEPLPSEIFRRWKDRFGREILDGLGSTEVLHIYLSSYPGRVRVGSSGFPVEGYQVRLVNDRGEEVPVGEVGDVVVHGESTAPYYWNRPELSRDRMRDDGFVSGDKCRLDLDGYYWYVGRSDDMFKVAAEWVSPAVVESALIEHPAVLEAAVVPEVDPQGLTKCRAVVVLKPGRTYSPDLEAEVRAFVRSRLPVYACPDRLDFAPELPKSATGKLLRYKLRGS